MDLRFSQAAARLAGFPMLGRPSKIEGARELIPHRSYRVLYEIKAETLWILAIVHTARQWPPVQD